MPYYQYQCSTCDRVSKRYHNAKHCAKCGGPILREGLEMRAKSWAAKLNQVETENRALRSEVNRLRVEIGLGLKYEEYNGTKENANG